MEGSAVGGKANFFERPVSDYVAGAVRPHSSTWAAVAREPSDVEYT